MHSILTALKQTQAAKISQQELNPQTLGRLQAQYGNFQDASPFETYIYPQQLAEVPKEHYEQLYRNAIRDIQSKYESYLLEEEMSSLKMEVYLLDQNITMEHHRIEELNRKIEAALQRKEVDPLRPKEDKFEEIMREIAITNAKLMEPKKGIPKQTGQKTLRLTTVLNVILPGGKRQQPAGQLRKEQKEQKEQSLLPQAYLTKLYQEIEFTRKYLAELRLSLKTAPHLKQEIKRGKTALKTLMNQFWLEVSRQKGGGSIHQFDCKQ